MDTLKLVVWDLDDTLVRGVFAEQDRDLDPRAAELLVRLRDRGILQALATQNEPTVLTEAVEHYAWDEVFDAMRADYAPKKTKVQAILDELDISPRHTAFIDEDAFERDAMAVQLPGLAAWSIGELADHLDTLDGPVTAESRRRPEMYRAMRRKELDEARSPDYEEFLASCGIEITVRPFETGDADRIHELLTRTNRMNLGSALEPGDAVGDDADVRLVVAELSDRYGDSGRCGFVRVRQAEGPAVIESCAISCRARARGLSLALLVGMLRHPAVGDSGFRCTFRPTGHNRPLRMLLWAAGFTGDGESDELRVEAGAIEAIQLPAWVQLRLMEGARTC